jgi:hypothetical protein
MDVAEAGGDDMAMSMMEPEEWPIDAMASAELVVRIVDDLVGRTEEERDILLSDMLCVAWPSRSCQDN